MRTKYILFGGLVLVLLSLVAWGVAFVKTFPQKYPEKTLAIEAKVTEFFHSVTLPLKIAQLSAKEPDAHIRMPVYGARVSSIRDTWGASRGNGRVHEGQDIFAARGTPVFSGTNGYILRIGNSGLGGNHVFVIGAGGRRYYYAHLDAIAENLHPGQYVNTDTVIGFVGATGNAETTPPHLHFGMYERRKALNPLPLLIDR